MTPIMRRIVKPICIAFWGLSPVAGWAGIDLPLPDGTQHIYEQRTDNATLRFPIGTWTAETGVPHEKRSGKSTIATAQLRATAITAQQVAAPIRQAWIDAGFRIVLDCVSQECGGFEYRVNTPIEAPPNMYINLRNFVSVTGIQGQDRIINVLISRIGERVYIQERRIDPLADTPRSKIKKSTAAMAGSAQNIAANFAEAGAAALDGLVFTSGSTKLGDGPFAVLSDLANYMRDNPDTKIVLVGHSDAVGGLDGNIEISKQRAEAVRQRMISKYGFQKSRISAQGIAFLAPRASNQTDEGRERNRRVEAVIQN